MNKNSWRRSLAERVSFSVSLFIVGIIITLVCYTWVTGDNNPPILSITTGSNIRQVNQQYYVPFTVENYGGETAESVEIIANLAVKDRKDSIVETGRQQIDFLSRQEKQSGEFIFTHDPQQGELNIRVASYKLP